MVPRRFLLALSAVVALVAPVAAPVAAQTVPTLDTEDARLGSDMANGTGRVRPLIAFDLRNGDYARGAYDDDRADLRRLPVHVQLGLAIDLSRGGDGDGSWLVLRSSNGVHAPADFERRSPRAWYESNNLAALVVSPAPGLRTAAAYTIKVNPNGVADTTHEASVSLAYQRDAGWGALKPHLVATLRPKGGAGVYTQAGIEPDIALGDGDDAPTLSLPALIGIGWDGFYDAGSGDRMFASTGVALSVPVRIAGAAWTARAEAVALVRDARLAALSGPRGETGQVVPMVTLALSAAY